MSKGVFRRISKAGKDVWIQASYIPLKDRKGSPYKVIKYATDITRIVETGGIAEQTVQSVQSVAAAIEEMTASVQEISRNMSVSHEASQGIVADALQSADASGKLHQATEAIEGVVGLIRKIAGQVNLLALNATIEAARAGEAGRGFAVVAAEVKTLATQTAQATEDISARIADMQHASELVGESIEKIKGSAEDVNRAVSGVAASIEEQTAVNQEISNNTQQIARLVEDISVRIKDLTTND